MTKIENSRTELSKLFELILRKPTLRPPVKLKDNKNLIDDFNLKCERFKECLNEYISDKNTDLVVRVKNTFKAIETLQNGIVDSLECYLSGDIQSAYESFERMLEPDEISQHLINISIPINKICNNDSPLYRVRKSEKALVKREEIFHIPFSQRHLVKTQRYSVAGLPCLYLGSSLYICWREMDKPDFDKLYISAFTTTQKQKNEYVLNLGADFLFKDRNLFKTNNVLTYDVDLKLSYLALWPLILACNYLKSHPDASFIQEYIIPNLLMQWISRGNDNNIIGIAYRSTKLPNGFDGKRGLNVVLPPKTRYDDMMQHEYCPNLAARFMCTPPVSWQVLKTLDYIPERQSVSNKEKLSEILRRKKRWEIMDHLDDEIVSIYELTDFHKLEVCIDEIQVYEKIKATK
ncbi:hypothetical protein [Kluyvera georgiana]|uniref:hypothetical protein n=1 Tax=Kluyvera georgiana TaxID=73098 RepID=UPI0032203F11